MGCMFQREFNQQMNLVINDMIQRGRFGIVFRLVFFSKNITRFRTLHYLFYFSEYQKNEIIFILSMIVCESK